MYIYTLKNNFNVCDPCEASKMTYIFHILELTLYICVCV